MINRLLPCFGALLLLFFLTTCDGTSTTGSSSTTADATSDTATETGTANRAIESENTEPSLAAPACEIEGEVLDGNRIWLQSTDVLAIIKADESTTQEGFGPSHRIFEIRDGRSCELQFTTTLPENQSPDFPYYVADIQYNNGSNLVGIRGFYDAYVCDLNQDNKLTKCSPSFYTEREYEDAQSGMIQRLEVWEDYLLGYAQDCGTFAFDLSDPNQAVAVLPFAEWRDPDIGRYHSLFLLPTNDGVQGIMPYFDAEEDSFMLYPLFDEPQQLSTNVPKSARNNQFLVLRNSNTNQPFAINLGTRDLMDPPTDVSAQGTQEILDWMRNEEQ
ncbi:MAG: hypothetical protein AAGJ93_04255 [Bacteroidota bacterium]